MHTEIGSSRFSLCASGTDCIRNIEHSHADKAGFSSCGRSPPCSVGNRNPGGRRYTHTCVTLMRTHICITHIHVCTHTCSHAHPQPHMHMCQQRYAINTIKHILSASLRRFAHTCIRAHPYTQEEAASTLLANQVLANAAAEVVASAASTIASEVRYMYHATRFYSNSGSIIHV